MAPKLKTILYVEDDDSIAAVAKMTLEMLGGYKVIHCVSGKEAINVLRTMPPEIATEDIIPPQLVLMDVMMPEMDGPTTIKKFRALPDSWDIPVIFMTAKAQTHEQQSYLALGAAGVIVKPFDPQKLCSSIEELWEKAHG